MNIEKLKAGILHLIKKDTDMLNDYEKGRNDAFIEIFTSIEAFEFSNNDSIPTIPSFVDEHIKKFDSFHDTQYIIWSTYRELFIGGTSYPLSDDMKRYLNRSNLFNEAVVKGYKVSGISDTSVMNAHTNEL